jgi:hypothetical protein
MNDDTLFYMDVLQTLISKRNKPSIPYHADFTVTDFVATKEGRFKFTLNAQAEPNGFFYKVLVHADDTKIVCFERRDGITSNYRLYISPSLLEFVISAVAAAVDSVANSLSLTTELNKLRTENKNLRNQLDRVKKLVCQ